MSAGSAMAYLNSDEQVLVPPLDRFDQYFVGKGQLIAPGRHWLRFHGQDDLCPALAEKLRLRGEFGASVGEG